MASSAAMGMAHLSIAGTLAERRSAARSPLAERGSAGFQRELRDGMMDDASGHAGDDNSDNLIGPSEGSALRTDIPLDANQPEYVSQFRNMLSPTADTSKFFTSFPFKPSGIIGASSTIPDKNPMSLHMELAEPIIFLTGFDQHDMLSRPPVLLRGRLIATVTKKVKVRAITLRLNGKGRTNWPEGIPPKKNEVFEEESLISHVWPFFHAQVPSAEFSTMADSQTLENSSMSTNENKSEAVLRLRNRSDTAASRLSLDEETMRVRATSESGKPLAKGAHGISESTASSIFGLPFGASRSYDRVDGQESTKKSSDTVAGRGYRVFEPGEYVYNFEHPIGNHLPESISTELGSVKYMLEATVERPGAFKSNVTGKQEILIVRNPYEGSIEFSEPIAISRQWEDQLHYDIVVSGKVFPLGSYIPIAFKFTPLTKVKLHRIKIYMTENAEYFAKNKKVHRLDVVRKLLLYEKSASNRNNNNLQRQTSASSQRQRPINDTTSSYRSTSHSARRPGETPTARPPPTTAEAQELNLLEDGSTDADGDIGACTELELAVKLPGCQLVSTQLESSRTPFARQSMRFHPDTSYSNVVLHHWIKIVLRISKQDDNNPGKRRHFEISIDSPIQLLSVCPSLVM